MGGNKKETKNLVVMLSEQIPELVAEIKEYHAQNNFVALYQAAHKLKSSVKLFKVKSIDTAIDAIEKISKENSGDEELASHIATFCPEAESIVTALLKKVS